MMQRTQISLDQAEHRRARQRASELGISLAEYVRRLVRQDLDGLTPQTDVSVIFNLGEGEPSDIAAHKDQYIGAAIAALHPEKDGSV